GAIFKVFSLLATEVDDRLLLRFEELDDDDFVGCVESIHVSLKNHNLP
ncbi:23171_t:CDS:1, partial [Dentiscutata erythropus]